METWRWLLTAFSVVIISQLGICAEIQSVKLLGGPDNYINIHSTGTYSMQCNFRSGYDDPVQQIKWYKDNKPVYSWKMKATLANADGDLSGRVVTSGDNLQNIKFVRPSLEIGGNYTCEVVSKNSTVRSTPYTLSVLDVSPGAYSTSVSLIQTVSLDSNATTNGNEQNCTLLWQFHTPAIFPRPNVTCGYYSYLHDDVTQALPAGLTMHRLQNGSWLAGFDHTLVEIADMPRETRLGCSVRIPDTSYKQVVKFEDNFQIDHLIDSQGCPTMFMDASNRLKVSLDGSIINCRGDLVPISKGTPIKALFSCDASDFALFKNGTSANNWSIELQCDATSMQWRPSDAPVSSSQSNYTDMPMCISRTSSGAALPTTPLYFVIFTCLFAEFYLVISKLHR